MERVIVLWGVGGSLGLILVVAGAVMRSTATAAAGVVILIVTLLVAGAALIAVQVYGDLREHRLAQRPLLVTTALNLPARPGGRAGARPAP
jgi:hypothetical protein